MTLDLVKADGETKVFLPDGVHFTDAAQRKQEQFLAVCLREQLGLAAKPAR